MKPNDIVFLVLTGFAWLWLKRSHKSREWTGMKQAQLRNIILAIILAMVSTCQHFKNLLQCFSIEKRWWKYNPSSLSSTDHSFSMFWSACQWIATYCLHSRRLHEINTASIFMHRWIQSYVSYGKLSIFLIVRCAFQLIVCSCSLLSGKISGKHLVIQYRMKPQRRMFLWWIAMRLSKDFLVGWLLSPVHWFRSFCMLFFDTKSAKLSIWRHPR